MPANVVKTPRQEHLWKKAKTQAENAGKTEDYAYIMGIFKNMGGLDKSACVMLDILSKEAGFVGKVLGKNVGKVEKEMGSLKDKITHTKDTMNSTKGWFGRKFTDSSTRRALKPDYEKLKGLKGDLKTQKKETFKARAKTLGGAAAIGAGVTGAQTIGDQYSQNRNYGNNDELKPQYLASEYGSFIEKTAELIVKEASLASLKNVANLTNFKRAKSKLDHIATGVNPTNDTTVSLLNSLKASIINMTKTNKAYEKGLKNVTEIRQGDLGKANAFARKSFSEKSDIIKNNKTIAGKLKTVIEEQQKVIDATQDKFNSMYKELVRVTDVEKSKAIGLYAGGAAALGSAGYGVGKLVKKQET